MRNFYCISGLPRSGSTLFCNILAQNPLFHATHTSGCLDVLFLIRNQWHKIVEHISHPNDEALLNVLKAMLASYYQHIDKEVIIDKNRSWVQYIPFLENIIGKKAKILALVRPIPDILASIERIHQKTTAIRQPPGEAEHFLQMQTLAGRCEVWMNMNSFLGLAYARLANALNSEYADRIHLVEFEKLTNDPESTMKEVYKFLEEKPFDHNFNHVDRVTWENDAAYEYVDLHEVRKKVEPIPSYARRVLGDELYFRYKAFDIRI